MSNPFDDADQYTDPETGLQYLRARYYEATTGQFLSRDPMVSSTRDAYGYAARSPLDHADPTGLDCGWAPGDWDDCAEDAGDAIRNVDPVDVVQFIHDASGVVAGVAGVCAAVGAVTVVGAPVAAGCGGVAAGAATVNVGTSVALYATGNESLGELAFDVGTAGTGYVFGRLAEAGHELEVANPGTGFFPSCKEFFGAVLHGAGNAAEGIVSAVSGAVSVRGRGPQ